MGYIRNIIYDEGLVSKSRMNKGDFTRKRKVGFITLLLMILNMIKKSTQLEIDDFLKKFDPEGFNSTTYTKQSFSEARQKLSPEAFKVLNNGFVQKFYEGDDFKKYKGFRLLAVDGSFIELPDTKEIQKVYGYVTNSGKDLRLARGIASKLYDVENGVVISAVLGRYDYGERELAQINIDKMLSFEEHNIKNLILFDRGYPSMAFIRYLNSNGIRFLMRVSSSFFRVVKDIKTNDEWVEIEITKDRARHLRDQGTPIGVGTIIKMRVVTVELKNGETEILITNLTKDELSYEECAELYFKRWGIETKFDELKNKFEIENFSGEKPIIVEQDFYATVLLSNIASIFEHEAEELVKEESSKKALKHEYKINKNILVGKLKNNLIEILLEDNGERKANMYEEFIQEIKRNVVPIIKDRNFERHHKAKRSNKYSNNRRRAL